jgi:2-dehydropantoate 2-reductase
LLATRLAEAGHAVAGVARGATLAAIRAQGGVVLVRGERRSLHPIEVDEDPTRLPPADLVILALKGPALVQAAASLAPLWREGTPVLPAMNGVPWWFMAPGLSGQAPPLALTSVDPGGVLGRVLPATQVVGAVVHLTCACPAPGTVRHGFGERLIVGEPFPSAAAGDDASPRLGRILQALTRAGFKAEASSDIRRDVWYKLWGNMTMNPVSALTGATADRILDDPLLRDFMARAMDEASEVGRRIGCPIEQSAADRMVVTRQLGAFKTSMLQDAEAGRPLELDALVDAVREIGRHVGVATPWIDALFGLARTMARQRGLYA